MAVRSTLLSGILCCNTTLEKVTHNFFGGKCSVKVLGETFLDWKKCEMFLWAKLFATQSIVCNTFLIQKYIYKILWATTWNLNNMISTITPHIHSITGTFRWSLGPRLVAQLARSKIPTVERKSGSHAATVQRPPLWWLLERWVTARTCGAPQETFWQMDPELVTLWTNILKTHG